MKRVNNNMITINKKGAEIIVTAKVTGENDKLITLLMDTKEQAECALLGRWRESRSYHTDKQGNRITAYALDFFPLDEHMLIYPDTGKTCRSFLPYIGLKPNSLRKNPKNRHDFRVSAFMNVKTRKCKLTDYIPASKSKQPNDSKVIPVIKLPIQQKLPLTFNTVNTLPTAMPTVDVDVAGATILTIMNLFKCDQNKAVNFIMQKIQGA